MQRNLSKREMYILAVYQQDTTEVARLLADSVSPNIRI